MGPIKNDVELIFHGDAAFRTLRFARPAGHAFLLILRFDVAIILLDKDFHGTHVKTRITL